MTCIVLHICCKLQPMVFFGKSLPSKMLLVSRNVYQVSLVYLFVVPEDMNPILSWPLAITSHLQRREHPGIYLTTLLNIQNHTLSSKTFKNNIMQKNNQDVPWHNLGFCLLIIFASPQTYTKKTQRIRSLATASSLSTCGAHRIPNPNPSPEESV